jgi:outer membrane protein
VFLLALASCPAALMAQERGAGATQLEDPILTLDDAVSLALRNNRAVKNSALEAQKSDDQVSVARSRRLPKFQVDVLAGSLLRPFDFTFSAGSFGTYPSTGPIPSSDAKIRTPAQFTTFTTASIDQPLTQLYKIQLGVRATELGREVAREALRAERQKVAADVRKAYFGLVASQAAVEAARQTAETLVETQRVTAQHVAQRTVLRADALEVESRLARSRYELSAAANRLATQREMLNDLLGRDVTTSFRMEPIAEQRAGEMTLESARRRAAENRPEIRQAQAREKQAQYERRLAKAEYIPDLSASVRYLGYYNFQFLPRNVAVAGLYLSWEPFDWGRRAKKVAEKTKALEQANNGAQQTQSQVAIEVGASYRRWSEAALLVQSARTGYEAATEQVRETGDRYKLEAALLRDLLQAQARTTEAQFQYQQALSSYWSAAADLRRAIGDE